MLEYIDTPGIRHLKALSPEEQLTSSQLGQLLRELREDKASYFGHLTYHLATALFFTGCRYHEWALLTIDRLCASREE